MAKASIKIARRYAKSLAELYPVPELDSLEVALKELTKIWTENIELREGLSNPAFKISERISVAKEIAEKIKPNDNKFVNFTCLICESGRIAEIEQITKSFSIIVAEIKKMLSLKISSAFKIVDSEKDTFKNQIQKEFGSLASIEWDTDESLIGGMQIKAGDKLLDSSIKGALQRLESSLLQK